MFVHHVINSCIHCNFIFYEFFSFMCVYAAAWNTKNVSQIPHTMIRVWSFIYSHTPWTVRYIFTHHLTKAWKIYRFEIWTKNIFFEEENPFFSILNDFVKCFISKVKGFNHSKINVRMIVASSSESDFCPLKLQNFQNSLFSLISLAFPLHTMGLN